MDKAKVMELRQQRKALEDVYFKDRGDGFHQGQQKALYDTYLAQWKLINTAIVAATGGE